MTRSAKIFLRVFGVCAAVSAMSACADNSGSSASDSIVGEDSASSVNSQVINAVQPSDESKSTLTIYCRDYEFKKRFDKYYPSYTNFGVELSMDADGNQTVEAINGIELNWVVIEKDEYQASLDAALEAQQGSAEKVDMFLVQSDSVFKYVNGDSALSVEELGITQEELSKQYSYVRDCAVAADTGEIKGVSWQASPGMFVYNAQYAREVLGTDDPEKVQEYVKDQESFTQTAELMVDSGIKMLSGYYDAYRLYSGSVSSPWVSDGKLTLDPKLKEWVDLTKEYTDKGYNSKTSLMDENWAAGQSVDGRVFGYFLPAWEISSVLIPNTVDEQLTADKSNAVEGNGGYGNWRACRGPQAYYGGGEWICGAVGADNTDIVADIMRVMTCDNGCMKEIAEGEQDFVNNTDVIEELIDEGCTNDFLGGQNLFELLAPIADEISFSDTLSPYDYDCNRLFCDALKPYFEGSITYEQALEEFSRDITALYSEISPELY